VSRRSGSRRRCPVYGDVSLKGLDEVVPAARPIDSALRIDPHRMAEIAGASWVDVCHEPAEE
jgi:prolyl-tRNA editing enzyme YbaK/EbsC (Cys-tRNA(Pro) deacylase)